MEVNTFKHSLVTYICVANNKGLKVTLSTFGASFYNIELLNKNMLLTPQKYEDFEGTKVYGKTLGRVAGRIKGNKITVNNKTYTLENNEGENTRHGGIHNFATSIFNYETYEDNDTYSVIFSYTSPHLEGGFPGEVLCKVIYEISKNENEIRLYFSGTTSEDTLLSLTNHAYFTLGTYDIDKLNLTIKASHFVDPSPIDLIPIDIKPVYPCLDFRNSKKISKDITDTYLVNSKTNGYDHYLVFDKVLGPQIILNSDEVSLEITTDFPGTQIYSDNSPSKFPFLGTTKLFRASLAIEPSLITLYNATHILSSEENFSHYIKYKFNILV